MAKLVYLDDDKIQQLLMKKLLKICLPNYTSEIFSTPEELHDWLEGNSVDLILSDLNFEKSSGWDWVSQFSCRSDAPIVFVTANSTPEDHRKVGESPNVKWVMDKPISVDNWQRLSELLADGN